MCVGRLLLTKDGACLQPLEYKEVPCGNYHPPVRLYWKEGLLKGVQELQAGAHAQFVGGRRLPPLDCLWFPCLPCVGPNVPKLGLGGACQKALLHCGAMALPTSWAQHRLGFPRCRIPWPMQCPPQPWTPLIRVDRAQRQT